MRTSHGVPGNILQTSQRLASLEMPMDDAGMLQGVANGQELRDVPELKNRTTKRVSNSEKIGNTDRIRKRSGVR